MGAIINLWKMPQKCSECPLADEEVKHCAVKPGGIIAGEKRDCRMPLCPMMSEGEYLSKQKGALKKWAKSHARMRRLQNGTQSMDAAEMRYIVVAFYPHLGLKVRTTGYSRKDEMYEYIVGLRMCKTPYCAMEAKTNRVLDMDKFGEDGEKLAKLLFDIHIDDTVELKECFKK